MFQVEMGNGRQVLAHVAEGFRLHLVRLLPGDRVMVELSPRDGRRGRIVSRMPGSSHEPGPPHLPHEKPTPGSHRKEVDP